MYNESKSIEIKIQCDCNVKLKVNIVKQAGLNSLENFKCPSCGKEYSISATVSIKSADVVVLKGWSKL